MKSQPMVSYSRGSMNSLLHKLTELMKNSTSEVEGMPRSQVEELLKALTSLDEDLVDEVDRRQEADGQVKAWMKQVRQLVVDIEDWVDTKLLNLKDLEDEICQDFMAEIREAHDRCTRYELLKSPTDPAVPVAVVPSNKSGQQLPEKLADLGGVYDPIEEIEKKLKDKDDQSLKVVSIVGIEGLGKTTLANKIYSKLKGKFDCQAFVSVGRRSTVSTILMDILHQLRPGTYFGKRVSASQVRNAGTDLRECLDTKRYLIIIDGVRSTREWRVINCALPDKNCGSRVLITTCIMNVAKSCSIHHNDFIHQMKALNKVDSESLFSGEAKIAPQDGILKICGGMPLAIIVAAGLLSRKTAGLAELKVPWKLDSTSEGMNKILHMSYADLSLPLKSCFLYLSVFPEDYSIEKERLIRLWRAEGFIPGNMWKTGERYFHELISRRLIQPVFSYEDANAVACTVHVVVIDFIASLSREENFVTVGAELKFGKFESELLWPLTSTQGAELEPGPSGTELQWPLTATQGAEFEPGPFERELQWRLGPELKPGPLDTTLPWLLTATPGAKLTSGPFLCYETVRRLSLHRQRCDEGDNFVSANVQLSRVRSLIVFRHAYGLPDLRAFKLIRVLDLEGAKTDDDRRFERPTTSYNAIKGLFLLRYLGLAGTSIASEDMEVITELKYLQTLDVRGTGVRELPSPLPNLVSILGDSLKFSKAAFSSPHTGQDMEVLSGINVKTGQDVEELSSIYANHEITHDVVSELLLGSSKLKILGVALYGMNTEVIIPFLERLKKSELESLSIDCLSMHELDEWTPSHKIRRFRLSASLPRVPESWDSLDSLTHLDIKVRPIETRDVFALSKLPKLIFLKLLSQGSAVSGSIVPSIGFQNLEVATFNSPDCEMGLRYEQGAMPKLRKLRLACQAGPIVKHKSGIQLPRNLMEIHVVILLYGDGMEVVEDARSALREQVAVHPNPNISLVLAYG